MDFVIELINEKIILNSSENTLLVINRQKTVNSLHKSLHVSEASYKN